MRFRVKAVGYDDRPASEGETGQITDIEIDVSTVYGLTPIIISSLLNDTGQPLRVGVKLEIERIR